MARNGSFGLLFEPNPTKRRPHMRLDRKMRAVAESVDQFMLGDSFGLPTSHLSHGQKKVASPREQGGHL